MKPENIVTSLEWSKKLKDAGWPQEALWYWSKSSRKDSFWRVMHPLVIVKITSAQENRCKREKVAAPTAEEILRMLPIEIDDHYALQIFRGSRISRGWVIYYESMMAGTDEWLYEQYDSQSLANAAASMWICLAEENLLPSQS